MDFEIIRTDQLREIYVNLIEMYGKGHAVARDIADELLRRDEIVPGELPQI